MFGQNETAQRNALKDWSCFFCTPYIYEELVNDASVYKKLIDNDSSDSTDKIVGTKITHPGCIDHKRCTGCNRRYPQPKLDDVSRRPVYDQSAWRECNSILCNRLMHKNCFLCPDMYYGEMCNECDPPEEK